MEKSIGYNIKKLREDRYMTQSDLANIIGVSDKTISSWEKGNREPRMGAIQKMSEFFGVLKSDIIETEGSKHIEENFVSNNLIKVYGTIACGTAIEAIENIVDEIYCPYNIKGELFALKVKGDSMDKIILDGYYALLRKQEDIETGDIAAVLINGCDATLKKVHKIKNTLILEPLSNNKAHNEQVITQGTDIKILGKYIGAISPMHI